MDTGNVIINVNELKAACFDILVSKGLSLDYVAGMKKVFDLINEFGEYTEEQ